MKERIIYYDIAKGIGIFLVVYAHICLNMDYQINDIIYTFHMPLFFVLSGMTFRFEKNFRKFVFNIFYSIMIPYFIWSVLSFVYWAGFEKRFRSEIAQLSVGKAFCGIFVGSYYWLPFNYVLWFLPVLFIVKILFWMLKNYLPNWGIAIAIFTFSVLGIWMMNTELVWGINRAFRYIVFFALGQLIKSIKFTKLKFKTAIWLGCFFCLLFLFLHGFTVGIFYYLLGGLGSIATIVLAADMEVHTQHVSQIVSKLGTITLAVLVMHGPLYRASIGVIAKVLQVDTGYLRSSIPFSLVLSVIMILLIVYPTRVIYKYAPICLGKKKPHSV